MIHFIVTEEDVKMIEKPIVKAISLSHIGEGYQRSAYLTFSVTKKSQSKDFYEIHVIFPSILVCLVSFQKSQTRG